MTVISRRNFIKGSALIPMISPMAAIARLSNDNNYKIDETKAWILKARNSIPTTKDAFFQTAGIGPSPKSVMEAVSEKMHFQNEGPVNPQITEVMSVIEPNLRKHLSEAFGSHENEVALTHSTSEGINIASWSINWEKGDEVLITNQEHPANIIPWYSLSTRFGVKINRLNFATGTDIIDEIQKKVNNKTRMVSIPHVSRNNGRTLTREESEQIANILRKRNVRYHLDGAQGPLCVPFNFHELECDYYSACGHKWILGPKGTGAFFCRKEILDSTRLTWTGSHSHSTMDQKGNYELIPEARRFEFGTRGLATFAGFDEALNWNESIGISRILKRIDDLVIYAIQNWTNRGFKVISPTSKNQRSGVFVIQLPNESNGWEIYNSLRVNESTFTSPVDGPNHLRVAIHFFNTQNEIKKTFDIIEGYCKK
ncbi:MAG: hypothetical protein CMG71_05695 [Candidatus Marinimicrobia bacterium]|nr:hypothetical protein [Candidatus Neomarinimicrobiota bacterium]